MEQLVYGPEAQRWQHTAASGRGWLHAMCSVDGSDDGAATPTPAARRAVTTRGCSVSIDKWSAEERGPPRHACSPTGFNPECSVSKCSRLVLSARTKCYVSSAQRVARRACRPLAPAASKADAASC